MRVHVITLIVSAIVVIAGAGLQAAAAQTPPGSPAPKNPPVAGEAAAPAAKPAAPDNYSYDPRGRRDPFINLLGTGIEPRLTSRRGEGAGGWTVAEISVRGIVQSRGVFVAMVRGPDTRTFLVHEGDKFLDGTVKAITPQGLVIVQEVNDPLSLIKQREIRKPLRTLEDTKP